MPDRLIYVSTATSRRDLAAQAAEIARRAQAVNLEQGIGGALVGHDGHFVQALEGEPQALDALLRRLEDDPRHYDLVLVDRRRVDDLLFAGWGMAGVALDRDIRDRLDALIANPTLSSTGLAEALRGRTVPPGAAVGEAGPV